MFILEKQGRAGYATPIGTAYCAYHLLRDGVKEDPNEQRRLLVVVEQLHQKEDDFAPSIQVHWRTVVQSICDQEELPNYLEPGAPEYHGARGVHWYEWWPVQVHGSPFLYDLIKVGCYRDGELYRVHMAAHIHDAMLAAIGAPTQSESPVLEPC